MPQATCQAAYGASYVKNKTMTMYDLIGALDPAGAAALNPALNPAAAGLKVALSAMRVSCSRIANGEAMLYQTTAKALERTLYCGYFKARCNRSAAVPNEVRQRRRCSNGMLPACALSGALHYSALRRGGSSACRRTPQEVLNQFLRRALPLCACVSK